MSTREALELLHQVREVQGDGSMLPREIAEKYEELVTAYRQAQIFIAMTGLPDGKKMENLHRLFGEFNFLYSLWTDSQHGPMN